MQNLFYWFQWKAGRQFSCSVFTGNTTACILKILSHQKHSKTAPCVFYSFLSLAMLQKTKIIIKKCIKNAVKNVIACVFPQYTELGQKHSCTVWTGPDCSKNGRYMLSVIVLMILWAKWYEIVLCMSVNLYIKIMKT